MVGFSLGAADSKVGKYRIADCKRSVIFQKDPDSLFHLAFD